jgi:hypothetical protein
LSTPSSAKTQNPGLADAIARAFDRCLTRDPVNRYADTAGLAADLRAYLAVEAIPVPVLQRTLPLLIEGVPVFVVGAALVLLIGWLAGYRPGNIMTLAEALVMCAPSLVYWLVMDAALGGSWLRRRWSMGLVDVGGDSLDRKRLVKRAALKCGFLSYVGILECVVITFLIGLIDEGDNDFLPGVLILLTIPVAFLFVVLLLAGFELIGRRFPEMRAANFWMQGMSPGFHPLHDQWIGTRLVRHRKAVTTEDFQAFATPNVDTTVPHTKMGHYDLVRRLGAGAMGTVFLGWDRTLGRPVAVKIISRSTGYGEHRERFEREARLAAQVSHPNVAAVFETGGWDADPYIAMEFIDGDSLQARMERQGALPLAEAWGYAIQIARGLQAADRAGVVHRDVKPANAMIDPAGVVKLTDFGVSRTALPGDHGLTQPGGVVGTPLYMPPEQARGQQVDCRSDMYALGMTLYFLLTSRTAFTAHSREDLLALQLTTDPEPLLGKVPGLNSAQEALIRRLLSRDPAQRFPDYETLLDKLHEEAPQQLAPASAFLRAADGFFFCLMGGMLFELPLLALGISESLASHGTVFHGNAFRRVGSNPFYVLLWQAMVVLVGTASLALRPGFPRQAPPAQAGQWRLLGAFRLKLTQFALGLLVFWPVFHQGSGLRVVAVQDKRLGVCRSLTRILANFPVLLPWPVVVILFDVALTTAWQVIFAINGAVAVVNTLLLVISPRRLLGDLVAGTTVERILPPKHLSFVLPSKSRSYVPAMAASLIGLGFMAWLLGDLKTHILHDREQFQIQETQSELRFIGENLRLREELIQFTHPKTPQSELLRIRREGAAQLRSFQGKNLIAAPRFPGSSLQFAWEVSPKADWPLGRPDAVLAFEPLPDKRGGRYVLMGDGKTVRYLPEEEFQRLLGH